MSHTHGSDSQLLRNYGYLKFKMIWTLRTSSETCMRLSASDIQWSNSSHQFTLRSYAMFSRCPIYRHACVFQHQIYNEVIPLISLLCVHTPCFHVAPYIDTEVKSGDRGGQLSTTTTTMANPSARELSHMSTDAAPLCGKNICNLGSSVKIILDFYSQFHRVENWTNITTTYL
jgi:hypothetical protein